MSKENGRARAMTVFTPLRPGMLPVSRWTLWVSNRIPVLGVPLKKLSFIHFAWWGYLEEIPYNGPPQRPERLCNPYFVFETNFNGTWDAYIDAFSYVIPFQMWMTWMTSWKFPGPIPVTRFKEYIRRNEYEVAHYYAAYPDASVTMVMAALRVQDRFEEFQEETRDLGTGAFAAAYRRFVAANQKDL